MIRRWITVSDRFEGFHRWPKAPDEVGFLRNSHRHLFHVRVTIEVKGDDRELEFFLVKKFLNEEPLETLRHRTTFKMGSSLSCEMMAEFLAKALAVRYGENRTIQVEVSEDGENGGIVTLDEALVVEREEEC